MYRFGHSMLTERDHPTYTWTDRPSDSTAARCVPQPQFYNAGGLTRGRRLAASSAASHLQVGNELDEFVTSSVRNKLVGLPLDLPAINIARGRSKGIPR